jgi:hypothetical protein
MFSVHCPSCGHTVLLGNRRLLAIDNVGGAIVVRLACFCGEVVSVRTGRRRDRSDRTGAACSPSAFVPSA